MNANTIFVNHFNFLVDKYLSPTWNPSQTEDLQDLAISQLFKSIREDRLPQNTIESLPHGVQHLISLRARNFQNWTLTKKIITEEIADELLERLRFVRNQGEKGSNREILLKRIFEFTISQATPQEHEIILHTKRSISPIVENIYSFISVSEKVQLIIGRMIASETAKVMLTLVMIATAAVALYTLYLARPDIILTAMYTYVSALNYIPWAINATIPLRYFSLCVSMISGAAYYFIRARNQGRPPRQLEPIFVLSGIHAIFSEISVRTNIPLSKLIRVVFSLIPGTAEILLLPFLLPIALPIVAMIYTANSSTSLASRLLNATSRKLTAWRISKESQSIRDIWIQSFTISNL